MEKYIGVKIIDAKPMTYFDFVDYTDRPCEERDNEHGYLVKYEGGYESWSPKKTFEKAYRKTEGMTFGLALEAMKKGYEVTRKGWWDKDISVKAQYPNEHSKMTEPYIYMEKRGKTFPLQLSCESIFAEDWIVIIEDQEEKECLLEKM